MAAAEAQRGSAIITLKARIPIVFFPLVAVFTKGL